MLAIGVGTRLALERLRLLMVPRLSIMLCVVVLSVAALSLVGDAIGVREFFAGVLFPIVILTMLVERFTIAIAEEGLRAALRAPRLVAARRGRDPPGVPQRSGPST